MKRRSTERASAHRHAVLLALGLAAAACAAGSDAVVTRFDAPTDLPAPTPGSPIVKLKLEAQGQLSRAVVMQLGCGETVFHRVTVPAQGRIDLAQDWYDPCLRVSFEGGAAVSGTLKLHYRFVTL